MSLRVVQTPESLADIALQADYYAQRESIALAQRFTDAIKVTVRLLANHPWIGKETVVRIVDGRRDLPRRLLDPPGAE